ncbi:unnamed protein product [Parascedosporium putredinis]|uniref:Uncharacterized protein n=1 Tax=Parascedosporium putredinis TaxID=1442378 RepID=A0A9P1MGA5_9PEZI|nr:unnamed protein product [Parascedosporium putredinis]CAI8004079.1 unnamed protein product [Parascedosporium putredinis]
MWKECPNVPSTAPQGFVVSPSEGSLPGRRFFIRLPIHIEVEVGTEARHVPYDNDCLKPYLFPKKPTKPKYPASAPFITARRSPLAALAMGQTDIPLPTAPVADPRHHRPPRRRHRPMARHLRAHGAPLLATKSSPIPLLALSINLAWEIVFTVFVTEHAIERFGFALWLAFDAGIIYVTLAAAPYEWGPAPRRGEESGPHPRGLGGRRLPGAMGLCGLVWYGVEGIDTTELAYWTAGFAQVVGSALSVWDLFVRGHSGGTSYGIWLARTIGTQCGLTLNSGLLWWYWPEAHAYYLTAPSLSCSASPLRVPSILKAPRIEPKDSNHLRAMYYALNNTQICVIVPGALRDSELKGVTLSPRLF